MMTRSRPGLGNWHIGLEIIRAVVHAIERWRAAAAVALLGLVALSAHSEHVMLESYQEAEGLTNLTSSCLVQDPRGRLWICTDNGLFRYDGFRVHAEPLPKKTGSYLYGARMDARGRLWVLAEDGVYIRDEDASGPRWTKVFKPDGRQLRVVSSQQLDFGKDGTTYALDRDRLVWTADAGSALNSSLVVTRHALPVVAAPPSEWPPMRWHEQALWFGCGQELCTWRNGLVEQWGVARGLPKDTWGHLLLARDGSLWARGIKHLARLAPHATEFEALAAPTLSRIRRSTATIEDPQGAIVTASDRGIASWDGKHWREWTAEEGLPDTLVRVLLFDAEGSLWLGANVRGVHRWIGYGQMEHWTAASGLPSSIVIDVARDGSGRLWAATREGIAWFDPAARRFRRLFDTRAAARIVFRLAVDGAGDLWWVEEDGRVMTVKAGSLEPRTMARDRALYGVEQGAGRVFLKGAYGLELIEVSGGKLRRHKVSDGHFDPRSDMRVVLDGDDESFVTNGRTLWRGRTGGWVPVKYAQGEPIDSRVAAVVGDTLWVSGLEALVAFALSKDGVRQLEALPNADLAGASRTSLKAGPDGSLWIGTDQGVFIREAGGTWSQLDRRTGLIWNDVNVGFLADPDGGVWIGTTSGLTHLMPRVRPRPLPALRLEEVALGGHAYASLPGTPVTWEERFVRITVGTAGFSRARSLRVEYRLGADAPWQTTQGPVIDLGALESGSRVLEVRAVGSAPVELPGPVLRIPLEVRPPWWGSAEARAAFASTLLLLWWLSIRWLRRWDRARQRTLEAAVADRTAALASSEVALRRLGEHNAQALEEERLRVSRELHDELGQQLAALRMEMSVAKARTGSSKSMEPSHLETLMGRVDLLVRTVRGLVSQLRPPALDGGLGAALQWLVAEFTSNTHLPCTLNVDPCARELSVATATMVFRIAQESLTNVRRHAQAGHVNVSLSRDGAAWLLTVSDDGVGFDAAARKAGFGILGMEERARLLGGTLEVHSAVGAGTRVLLRVEALPSAA